MRTRTGRDIAGLIGMNQQKINQKVKEGALPEFQQRIPQEAAEETQEKLSIEEAQRNADLRSKYLIGNDTAAVRDFLIRQLSMKLAPRGDLRGRAVRMARRPTSAVRTPRSLPSWPRRSTPV